jgi:hypothetical protein
MAKKKKTLAVFDVAKEDLLALISEWREQNIPKMTTGIAASFSKCTAAGNDELKAWRAAPTTLQAKLLSVSSHGTGGKVLGCESALYSKASSGSYGEVTGAVVHLLACDSLTALAQALVDDDGALAVIGYSEPFALFIEDTTDPLTALPASAIGALKCDAVVLEALAKGMTVKASVDAAKKWASTSSSKMLKLAATAPLKPAMLRKIAWAAAVLRTNADFLGYRGSASATIT